MWDLILSVPDHCLSFYFGGVDLLIENLVLRVVLGGVELLIGKLVLRAVLGSEELLEGFITSWM